MLMPAARTLLGALPPACGIKLIDALATRTKPWGVSPLEQDAMRAATRLSLGRDAKHAAWSWGSGPLIVLVHGWGGRAAQMAPLATFLADRGFRAVTFDVTGHGDSPHRRTHWEWFIRDIAALTRALPAEVFAYVGHSAGGLSMMAARRTMGIRAQRYVCVCSPSYPWPFTESIRRKLQPPAACMEHYQRHVARMFDMTWPQLQAGDSFSDAGKELLLVYDTTDRYVSHEEGDKIKWLCPDATLVKTSAYGHARILAAAELAQSVASFLAA